MSPVLRGTHLPALTRQGWPVCAAGLFSEQALDTIVKFPMVTIEKGQGFHDGSAPCSATSGSCAEDKILAQIAAIKKRRASISTVFYMNSVLDWYRKRVCAPISSCAHDEPTY